MIVVKGLKFTMDYSPTLEGEVHAVKDDIVEVILIPSDGNAWWVRWSLMDMERKFKEGIYREMKPEIRIGI
jgi:hypothetical protein